MSVEMQRENDASSSSAPATETPTFESVDLLSKRDGSNAGSHKTGSTKESMGEGSLFDEPHEEPMDVDNLEVVLTDQGAVVGSDSVVAVEEHVTTPPSDNEITETVIQAADKVNNSIVEETNKKNKKSKKYSLLKSFRKSKGKNKRQASTLAKLTTDSVQNQSPENVEPTAELEESKTESKEMYADTNPKDRSNENNDADMPGTEIPSAGSETNEAGETKTDTKAQIMEKDTDVAGVAALSTESEVQGDNEKKVDGEQSVIDGAGGHRSESQLEETDERKAESKDADQTLVDSKENDESKTGVMEDGKTKAEQVETDKTDTEEKETETEKKETDEMNIAGDETTSDPSQDDQDHEENHDVLGVTGQSLVQAEQEIFEKTEGGNDSMLKPTIGQEDDPITPATTEATRGVDAREVSEVKADSSAPIIDSEEEALQTSENGDTMTSTGSPAMPEKPKVSDSLGFEVEYQAPKEDQKHKTAIKNQGGSDGKKKKKTMKLLSTTFKSLRRMKKKEPVATPIKQNKKSQPLAVKTPTFVSSPLSEPRDQTGTDEKVTDTTVEDSKEEIVEEIQTKDISLEASQSPTSGDGAEKSEIIHDDANDGGSLKDTQISVSKEQTEKESEIMKDNESDTSVNQEESFDLSKSPPLADIEKVEKQSGAGAPAHDDTKVIKETVADEDKTPSEPKNMEEVEKTAKVTNTMDEIKNDSDSQGDSVSSTLEPGSVEKVQKQSAGGAPAQDDTKVIKETVADEDKTPSEPKNMEEVEKTAKGTNTMDEIKNDSDSQGDSASSTLEPGSTVENGDGKDAALLRIDSEAKESQPQVVDTTITAVASDVLLGNEAHHGEEVGLEAFQSRSTSPDPVKNGNKCTAPREEDKGEEVVTTSSQSSDTASSTALIEICSDEQNDEDEDRHVAVVMDKTHSEKMAELKRADWEKLTSKLMKNVKGSSDPKMNGNLLLLLSQQVDSSANVEDDLNSLGGDSTTLGSTTLGSTTLGSTTLGTATLDSSTSSTASSSDGTPSLDTLEEFDQEVVEVASGCTMSTATMTNKGEIANSMQCRAKEAEEEMLDLSDDDKDEENAGYFRRVWKLCEAMELCSCNARDLTATPEFIEVDMESTQIAEGGTGYEV